jgi:NAD(P)H-nitrite reductase large subunit
MNKISTMENYCLKWNEFEANILDSFRKLREDRRLFDVTLATDDGHQIQAHKMILSTGSLFFSDIFMRTDHKNMLIYMKGINKVELEQVADFLYNGEVFMAQEELNKFLETAKGLQVKGLQSDTHNMNDNFHSDALPRQSEHVYTHDHVTVDQEGVNDAFEDHTDTIDLK